MVCVKGKGRLLYCFILAFIIVGEVIYIRFVDNHFVSWLFQLTPVQ
jgi:hypothetical protein